HPADDIHCQRAHFGSDVDGRAWRPLADPRTGGRDDRGRERLDVAVTEHRLHQPAVALPGGTFAGEQAVTEEGLQWSVGERLDVPVLVLHQDMLEVLGTAQQEEGVLGGQRYSDRVAISAAELTICGQRVAEHLRPVTQCAGSRGAGRNYC